MGRLIGTSRTTLVQFSAASFRRQASASVRWVDEYFFTNANEAAATNWAYTVVDLRFG